MFCIAAYQPESGGFMELFLEGGVQCLNFPGLILRLSSFLLALWVAC